MLIAHKIIDALLGRGDLMALPGVTKQGKEKMVERLRAAQKFDFGDLPLEENTEEIMHGRPTWKLPSLTKDEIDWWRSGLIPTPFKSVWYEFVLGGYRSGILITENGTKWEVERIDHVKKEIMFDQLHATVDRSTFKPYEEIVQGILAPEDDAIQRLIVASPRQGITQEVFHAAKERSDHWQEVNNQLGIQLEGNPEFLEMIKHSKAFMVSNVGMNIPLAIYLTLMLSSRTTVVGQAPMESPKLNKARIKRGAEPLPPHRIVRIVPDSFREAARKEGEADRRPPRLHWRRSHLRHYDHRVPSALWSEAVEHKGTKGWWVAVIARQLVGRAELGEVTHEYFIVDEQKKEAA